MAIIFDLAHPVLSYWIRYNFRTSQPSKSDRVAVIGLKGSSGGTLAELHFHVNRSGISVQTSGDDIDVLLPASLLESIHQTLRSERPLTVSFHKDTAGVFDNVWFGIEGTSSEPVGEEEGKGS